MDGESGLTGRFRTVDLDDSSTRIATYTEGIVQADRAGGNDFDVLYDIVAHLHDGTAAICLFDASHGLLECFESGGLRVFGCFALLGAFFLCHYISVLNYYSFDITNLVLLWCKI